jgi:two-component sensor histidine kinase
MREVDHRAKNALTVVQSILMLSRADDPEDFADTVQGRVAAMARAHTLLSSARWSGADLTAMVREELDAYTEPGRVDISGFSPGHVHGAARIDDQRG